MDGRRSEACAGPEGQQDWHGLQAQWQRRLAFERTITTASASLIHADNDSLDRVIADALGAIGSFFEVDRAYLFLIDERASTQSNTHEWVAEGISREAHNLQDVPLTVFPWLLEQLRRDQAMCVDAVADLPPEAAAERAEFQREGIQSIVVVPMWHGAMLQGFVGIDAVRRAVQWGEDYLVGLRLLAQMLGSALESRRLSLKLEAMAFHDHLTGLPNRKLMEDRLDVALQRIQRKQRSLCLAMIDLDDFKQINDGHGHAAGDQVLKEAAGRFQHTLRQGDTVARLGGDEFVLIIEDEGEQSPAEIARRLLQAFATPFCIGVAEHQVGLSIGLARARAGVDQPGDLLRRADAAMYRAKANGKNRWDLDLPG